LFAYFALTSGFFLISVRCSFWRIVEKPANHVRRDLLGAERVSWCPDGSAAAAEVGRGTGMGEKFQLTWTKVHVARWRINVSVGSAWAIDLPHGGRARSR
jgi:hypothetical protein